MSDDTPTALWCTACKQSAQDCRCTRVPQGQWIKVPLLTPDMSLVQLAATLEAAGHDVAYGHGRPERGADLGWIAVHGGSARPGDVALLVVGVKEKSDG